MDLKHFRLEVYGYYGTLNGSKIKQMVKITKFYKEMFTTEKNIVRIGNQCNFS